MSFETMKDRVLEMIAECERRGMSLAFVVVGEDGEPVYGHVNATYDLLGAIEVMQAGVTARLFRAAQTVLDDDAQAQQ